MTLTFDVSKALADYGRVLREWSVDTIRPHARQADTDHMPPANWREVIASCPVPIGSPFVQDGAPPPRFDEGYWVTQMMIYENVSYGDIRTLAQMSP